MMDITTITTSNPTMIEVGARVTLHFPRPSWWQVMALWRWWRNPLRRYGAVITAIDGSGTSYQIKAAIHTND